MKYVTCEVGEVVESYYLSEDDWIAAHVEQSVGWPNQITSVTFRDRRVILTPSSDTRAAALALRLDGIDWKEGRRLICEFCSSLAWAESGRVEPYGWATGSRPAPIARGEQHIGRLGNLDLLYLPEPPTREAGLALAFFREGASLDNVAYSFLSYFKILNLACGKGPAQVAWIREVASRIRGTDVGGRIREIEEKGADIGNYLYGSGRCAVAHAETDPLIDPDSIDDQWRLYSDLRLIRRIAEVTIEERFNIKSTHTIYKEHLYNLAGFKELLGPDLAQGLGAGAGMPRRSIRLPDIGLRLTGLPTFPHLARLAVRTHGVVGGVVSIGCLSPTRSVEIKFALDFPNETLRYDPINWIVVQDFGSIQSARELLDAQRFINAWIGNGRLEIWTTDSSDLLGRCDAFIPTKFWLHPDRAQAQISALERLVVERESGA